MYLQVRSLFLKVHIVSLLILLPLFGISAEGGAITVKGKGYPPIRAENSAQAHLLAKRAAVLDAYRNALKIQSAGSTYENSDYYTGLAGFIKGARVIKEEYLSDGGVIVTIEVESKDIYPPGGRDTKVSEESGIKKGSGKPERITIEEWYKVIDASVVYTN